MQQPNVLASFYANPNCDTFAHVVKKYQKLIHFWIGRRLPGKLPCRQQVAEELTQEVLLNVYRTAGTDSQWDGKRSKPETWMRKVTFNCCSTAIERYARNPALGCDLGTTQMNLGAAGNFEDFLEDKRFDHPDSAFRRVELRAAITKSLGLLREPAARIVQLYHFQGVTLARIAETLGLSVATVYRRLKEAERQLKDDLGDWSLGA